MNEPERHVKVELYLGFSTYERLLKAKTSIKLFERTNSCEETRIIEASKDRIICSTRVYLARFRFPGAYEDAPILQASSEGTFLRIDVPREASQGIPRQCANMLFDLLSYRRKEIEQSLYSMARELVKDSTLFSTDIPIAAYINDSTCINQRQDIRGLRF
ncbi:MAG: hypothetical protein KatS3mg083_628 [Candidatus Dojkabacteria bacterium]|nr:MAG: hypothetical protein KatS3mg083_628 [Candidatus Dojkabacteria bacterium]